MLPVLRQLREVYPDNTVYWESESMSQLVASRKNSSSLLPTGKLDKCHEVINTLERIRVDFGSDNDTTHPK